MEDATEFCNYWTGAANAGDDYLEPTTPKRDNTPPYNRLHPSSNRPNLESFRPTLSGYNERYKYDNTRPSNQQYPAAAAPQRKPMDATAAAVDQLTRRMEKLQINPKQAKTDPAEQQQKIYRLQTALRRPTQADHIHLREEPSPANPEDEGDETYYYDQGVTGYVTYYEDDMLLNKRSTPDGDANYARMPRQRMAISPANESPYTVPRRVTSPPAAPPHAVPPPNGRPFNTALDRIWRQDAT
ncbi:hypothetical protein OEZ85_002240 [Tetradesmus obliquus]|uniref:Uncharacterized protein n=1 Tax=Tetradesmus obliquus TaxID=3088 RepID=A0ABY8U2D2_TETOB|nr:hypothetical protein OEZ85_002240 [Tetradesmus obliquus]